MIRSALNAFPFVQAGACARTHRRGSNAEGVWWCFFLKCDLPAISSSHERLQKHKHERTCRFLPLLTFHSRSLKEQVSLQSAQTSRDRRWRTVMNYHHIHIWSLCLEASVSERDESDVGQGDGELVSRAGGWRRRCGLKPVAELRCC